MAQLRLNWEFDSFEFSLAKLVQLQLTYGHRMEIMCRTLVHKWWRRWCFVVQHRNLCKKNVYEINKLLAHWTSSKTIIKMHCPRNDNNNNNKIVYIIIECDYFRFGYFFAQWFFFSYFECCLCLSSFHNVLFSSLRF